MYMERISLTVGERSCIGILSLSGLGEYHRQFLAITIFLIGKGLRVSTSLGHPQVPVGLSMGNQQI